MTLTLSCDLASIMEEDTYFSSHVPSSTKSWQLVDLGCRAFQGVWQSLLPVGEKPELDFLRAEAKARVLGWGGNGVWEWKMGNRVH